MRLFIWILVLCAGCAVRNVPVSPASARLEPAGGSSASASPAAPVPLPPVPGEVVSAQGPSGPGGQGTAPAPLVAEAPEDEEEGGEEDEAAGPSEVEEEGESTEAGAGTPPTGPLYTAELSDEALAELWKKNVGALGSVSVGFVQSGRLVNSVRFPEGEDWLVVSPDKAWGTQETIDYMTQAIREVRKRFPKAPRLRVNQLSGKEGGYLRPHKSHQNGRDVDLGFYYPTEDPVRERARENYIDPALNWALIRALVTTTDVQMILVDSRVQKVIYEHALKIGEDKAWLDSLFNAGANSIVKHARRHRDHFHVRFYNPRAQELGFRLAPLLALQPDKNIAMHRVRSGDTLGAIALRYGASLASLKKSNRLRNSFLRIGQVLSVPLRGPCTRCPVPSPVVVPPRRLPVEPQEPAPVQEQAPAVEEPAVEEPAAPVPTASR